MRITQRIVGHAGVVEVEGAMTCLHRADGLERAVARMAARQPRTIVVDLATVNDMDAAGIGALVSACRASHRHFVPFRLAHVPRRIRRLIAVTGLAQVMEMFDSIEAAVDLPPPVRSAEAVALRPQKMVQA
jgi:anti-anti-sigma factor